VTDLTGSTGMAILRAIVAGERDPQRLAQQRDYRCAMSEQEIAQHLRGTWRDEHLFNLRSALALYDGVSEQIAHYDAEILQVLQALQPPERRHAPVPVHPNATKEKAIRQRGEQEMRTMLWRFAGVDLSRIDGISARAARVVLCEVGADLAAFPSEKHFVSWLRLCPPTAISGGKSLKSKRRNGLGATRIANALRMAATTLRRSKTALGAMYRRLARNKSAAVACFAVACFAVARKLAQLIYRMLRHGHDYIDVGEAAYEEKYRTRRIATLHASAASLGYVVVPQQPASG
jgi:transposase